MRKLIDFNSGEMLTRGLFPSLAENQAELWKRGKNVEFRERRVVKALGFINMQTSETPVTAIAQAFVEGERRVYWAVGGSIFMDSDGDVSTIGSGFDPNGRWSLEPWGSWLIATNNVDPVQVWKNTGTMVPLATVRRDTFKLVKKHKNHVLGYFGQSVDWSKDSDPETWVPAVNNSAGGIFIRDLDSDIIAACPLGSGFALYSADRMVLQRYIGEPFFFGFEPAVEGIGAVSDSAVVPVANRNYGMGKKGFYVTDGISYEYVDSPAIKRWLKDNFSELNGHLTVGLHDERSESVKWWFVGPDGNIRGVALQYKTGAWTVLDQKVTAAASLEVFDNPIVGSDHSWGFLTGSRNGSEDMVAELETFPLDAGQRENWKLWDLYRANVEGSGVEVRFGFSTEPDEEPEWTDWAPLTRENYINRESVFLRVALRSTGNVYWELEGFSVHGEVTGYL